MIRKDWWCSTKGYTAWSYRQLNKVDSLINKLEKANFVKKYFNKESVELLKEQKKFIERCIEKEKELWKFKDESKFHKSVDNIVKVNKRLEREIAKWTNVGYTSRREENKRKVWSWNSLHIKG